MGKTSLLAAVMCVLAASVFGEISLNWSMGIDGQPEVASRTVGLGIQFPLYQGEKADIRNRVSFLNGVMIREDLDRKYYKQVVAENVSFGRITRDGLFRPYGYVEGRVGLCGEDAERPFDNPVIWNVGLGTGLEIFASDRWCYFMEFGFLQNVYEGSLIPQQRFELGMKMRFK